MSPPFLTVIAGPNGSGKSTLINHLIKKGVDFGLYINADDIARENIWTGDEGAREAQAEAGRLRDEYLAAGSNFSFETVMSHPSKVEFMTRARSAGYYVTLFFVATSDPVLNLERVQARVALGGHDVPEDRVLARYHRSLKLLPQAIAACNKCLVFDNSSDGWAPGAEHLRPVAIAGRVAPNRIRLQFMPPTPRWALRASELAGAGFSISEFHAVPAPPPRVFAFYQATTTEQPDNSEQRQRESFERGLEQVSAGKPLSYIILGKHD